MSPWRRSRSAGVGETGILRSLRRNDPFVQWAERDPEKGPGSPLLLLVAGRRRPEASRSYLANPPVPNGQIERLPVSRGFPLHVKGQCAMRHILLQMHHTIVNPCT